MTSFRSLSVSALLATAAALTACGDKSPRDDLAGMTDAIAAACPVQNKTTEDRMNCAAVGQAHAEKLFKYAELDKKFEKVCASKPVSDSIPAMARPLIVGSQVTACLGFIEGTAKDAVVKKTAGDIKRAVQMGTMP